MTYRFLFIAFIASILFTSCRKVDEPISVSPTTFDVWLLNEGAFQAGNASFTLFSSQKDSTFENPFFKANGATLGDVGQAAYFINDECWVVVNNSNSIVVLDTSTFKIKKEITGLNTPRYADHDENNLYVGSLYSKDIYRISLNTKQVETFALPYSGVEKVLLHDDKLWVAFADSSCREVQVYDPTSMSLIESHDISPARNAYDMEAIGDDIFVLSGSSWLGVPARISKINNSQVGTNLLSTGEYKNLEQYNGELYTLANDYAASGGPNGVYKIDRQTMDIEASPLISAATGVATYYGFGINSQDGSFYLSDAKSYTVNGDAYRFSSDGTQLAKFEAGLIPGYFLFK